MTAGDAIGSALQLLGVGAMGLGVWRSWHEFALSDERFLDPLIVPIREAWAAVTARVAALWRRIRRRPRHVAVSVSEAISAGAAFNATVRVGFGPLDPSDPTAALLELERRIGQLNERLATVDERLADERNADRADVTTLRQDLERAVGDLESRDRRVALGGLRLEVLGLFLTVIGLVVTTAW